MWLLTLKSILLATDLDEGSAPAIRSAARLAPLAGAQLHLLHVAPDPMPAGELRLREHFRLLAPGAPEPDSVRVVGGSPAAAIVEHALRVGADAVILGPHRAHEAAREMGSTAVSVVREAPCPCLVAATELRLPLERVVVAIDLSPAAGGALSVGLSWASALRPREGQSLLTALHVATSPASADADREVSEQVRRARASAGGAARVEIGEMISPAAEPAAEILRAAASQGADLLVMGTRGAGGATSAMGSVSAAVARSTPCPLLLVPPTTLTEQHGAGPGAA